MALTIEIDHAKTRAKAAAADRLTRRASGRQRPASADQVSHPAADAVESTTSLRSSDGIEARTLPVRRSFWISRTDGSMPFFVEIWPQDHYLVTGLLILASTILIPTNALAVRLWCGFACPRIVWTDLFLLVERHIEGDRRQRLKNINAPLSA